MLLLTWKDRPDGLLECADAPDTFPVLGDASRGALYLALRPAASNGESPSPPPPERRAQPASCQSLRLLPGEGRLRRRIETGPTRLSRALARRRRSGSRRPASLL